MVYKTANKDKAYLSWMGLTASATCPFEQILVL
jgi:hypothetical protein